LDIHARIAMTYPFRNLVFEGGGVKGIAYIGAMQVLEKKGILKNIIRVGGASAGAINALLFGLGYTNEETHDILWQLDFRNFEDSSWWPIDVLRVFNRYGWYKGNFFKNWIGDLIEKKMGDRHATFADVARMSGAGGFRQISMIGTNLSTRFSEVYSAELTPGMELADAVRISMSIPLFFKAVRNPKRDVLVDGGVLDNYPVKLFDREKYIDPEERKAHSMVRDYYLKINKMLDRGSSPYVFNKQTLGFRLDTREESDIFRDHEATRSHRISSFVDYAKGLIGTMLEAQENQHIHSDDWQRTVYIDTLGVKTTDFDLSEEKKTELMESGKKNTELYFKWYDDPKSKPVNRAEDVQRRDLKRLKQLRKRLNRKK
jgi:NTE family protein